MRWFWIDRFIEFESGRWATSIKAVSLVDEHLHDHFHAAPRMPNSLVIEGIAQTGGLLVAEYGDFDERVVLAKISKAMFHFHAVPGDVLTYRAAIEDINKDGAVITATSHVGQRLQAEVELFFAHLAEDAAGKSLFEPGDFLSLLKTLGIFDIGRKPDGSPLKIPEYLARCEVEADFR